MNMKKLFFSGLAVLAILTVGCSQELSENEKALAEMNKAYQAFLETKPSADSILAFTDKFDELSWQFEQEGDLNTAIDCEKEMLRIYDVVWNGPVHRKAFRMWSIGYKYRELEVTDSADSYLNNAIEMSLECTKDSGEMSESTKYFLSNCYQDLALLYEGKDDDKAIRYLEAVINYQPLISHQDSLVIATNADLLANIYDLRDEYADALLNYKIALRLYEKACPDSTTLISDVREAIADMEKALADNPDEE